MCLYACYGYDCWYYIVFYGSVWYSFRCYNYSFYFRAYYCLGCRYVSSVFSSEDYFFTCTLLFGCSCSADWSLFLICVMLCCFRYTLELFLVSLCMWLVHLLFRIPTIVSSMFSSLFSKSFLVSVSVSARTLYGLSSSSFACFLSPPKYCVYCN